MKEELFRPLLPTEVALVEEHGDVPANLFPEEEEYVAHAVSSRRLEFATSRHCARRALALLGLPPTALVPSRHRAPAWPEGVIGSITHCAGLRAAAVARTHAVLALGIDAEPALPLPAGVPPLVITEAERAQLAFGPKDPIDRVLFSAKEAVYKALFPLTEIFLDFQDVEVHPAPDGTFHATVARKLPRGSPRELEGRWRISTGLILTAVCVLTERT